MSDPRVYYKALRLGDTVRSHPSPQVTVEQAPLTPTAYGDDAAMAEVGGATRCSIEIEPVLLRNFTATETDAAFMARKLTFANDLRRFSGTIPTTATTRFGTLAWVEDPTGGDSLGTFSPSGLAGPPAIYNTLTVTAYARSMAIDDRLLLVEGDLSLVVTLASAFTGGGTTIQIDAVETADWPAFTVAAVAYRLSWWLDDCAMSGDFKVGEGDKVARAAKGSVLRFDSVERFGVAG